MLSNTSQLMRQVIYALIPGVLCHFYFFGWTSILQILLAVSAALVFECLVLLLRKNNKATILMTISDGSIAVTAILLAVAIPAIAPWWLVVLGVFFATFFGKHIYGGLGHNPFNPAMLAYAFLLISYPGLMTQWQNDLFISWPLAIDIIFNQAGLDAITSATVLETKKQLFGSVFYINLAFLCGGLYLLWRKIIYWHIPVSLLLSLALFATLFHYVGDDNYLPAGFHLLTGATMLAAFFIATDPVSASTTPVGRIIYGALIGFLIILMRSIGNYADGVAFAILLANITVPLIDYYSQPKILGDKKTTHNH